MSLNTIRRTAATKLSVRMDMTCLSLAWFYEIFHPVYSGVYAEIESVAYIT